MANETEKNTAAIEQLIRALDMNSKATKEAGDTRRLGEAATEKRGLFKATANVLGGRAIKQVTEPMRQFFAPARELLTDIRVAQGKLLEEEDKNQSAEPEGIPKDVAEQAAKVMPAEPEGDAMRIPTGEEGPLTRQGPNEEVVAAKEDGESLSVLKDIASNVDAIKGFMSAAAEAREMASREAVTDQNFEAEEAATATRLIPETGEPVEKSDEENDEPGFLDKLKDKVTTSMTVVTTGLAFLFRKQIGSVIAKMSGMLGKTLSVIGKIISAPFRALGKILSTILRFLGPIGMAIGVGAAAFTGAKAFLENTETGKKIAGAASEGIGAVANFVKGETPETKEQAEIKEGIQSKTMDVNELTIQRIGANENLTPEQKKQQVGLIQEYTKQQTLGDVNPQIQDAYQKIVKTNAEAVPDITPEGKAAAIEPAPTATPQTQALTEESLKPDQSKAGDVAVSSTNIDTSSSSKQVIINQQPHIPMGF